MGQQQHLLTVGLKGQGAKLERNHVELRFKRYMDREGGIVSIRDMLDLLYLTAWYEDSSSASE
jgi:hypothetical protein